MSFVKREYVDQQTVITAENMNAIQDELLRLGVSEGSLWNSVTSAGTKASNALDNEAAAYNYHLQYHVGDYCLYQQKLYRCTVETPAAGETWNSSHWTAVTVGDEMIETASELSELRNTLNHKADAIYDTASGDIASFPDGADGLPVKDLTVAIEPVQSGTGDPSPTNVRPISGWTGASVTRTGKNLFDADNLVPLIFAADNPNTRLGNSFPWAGTYVIHAEVKPVVNNVYAKVIDASGNYGTVQYIANPNLVTNFTATVPTGGRLIVYTEATGTSANNVFKDTKLQVELGSVETAYEPYSGTTIPISWQSEAGTVYGGTLDVTSGVLTVDRAIVDLGTENWSYSSSRFLCYPTGLKKTAGHSCDLKCSIYPKTDNGYQSMPDKSISSNIQSFSNYATILIRDSSYSDTTAFKAAMSGVQLVYELATPQTYQLTPTEVTTLLGQNNIWADCGPSTVEYPADTKLYIERLTAPEEDDMIANQNIASGKYFMIGNNLYLSTTTIPAGDTINPGTNCTLTNLAAALNALNS